MTDWLPAWDVLCMYVGCGCVGAVVMALLVHGFVVAPLARENERLARELDEDTRTTWPNGPWAKRP